MKRMGMVIGVKPERIAEYKKTHAAVWPEVLAKISDCNMRNYTIFLREPENLLFGYFEAADSFQASLAGMETEEVNERWQAAMSPYFEALGGARPDENMLEITEVFHLD